MSQIIALGELHHGKHLEAIEKVLNSEKSIDGIFLEKSISYQDVVKEYLDNKTINEKLQRSFEGALREGKDIKGTTLFILDFARKQGIPVVCVDSSKKKTDKYNRESDVGYWFLNGESRDEDMFNNIVSAMKPDEKWIFICGSNHIGYDIHPRTNKATVGKLLRDKYGTQFSHSILH